MTKMNCMFHDDKTASLAIYPDGYYCFGCGAYGDVEDLPETGAKPASRNIHRFRKDQEDIKASLKRVAALPRKEIRGLELPYDDKGYYIVYPNCDYYVRRNWDGDNATKYSNPYGHRKQLLKLCYSLYDVPNPALLVVEGQINALTAIRLGACNIVSPGAATDFANGAFMPFYLQYTHFLLIVDKDAAGTVAALKLRKELVERGKYVKIYAMPKDLNQIYVEEGPEAARAELKKAMEV